MEMYSVEKIQSENKCVVKDASNKIVASFYDSSLYEATKEAENYAHRLNERAHEDRYRALSSATQRLLTT